jgi:hypothetical protein
MNKGTFLYHFNEEVEGQSEQGYVLVVGSQVLEQLGLVLLDQLGVHLFEKVE